jgi:TRAP-type transport system periplasmic protein
MARDDIADITYVNPGYQPGRFPIIAIGQMPFVFGDARKGTAALDSWYRKYADAEMKDTHFASPSFTTPARCTPAKKSFCRRIYAARRCARRRARLPNS